MPLSILLLFKINIQAWNDLKFGGLFMSSFILRWYTEW